MLENLRRKGKPKLLLSAFVSRPMYLICWAPEILTALATYVEAAEMWFVGCMEDDLLSQST